MSVLAMCAITGAAFGAALLILPRLMKLLWLLIVLVTPYGIVAGVDFIWRVIKTTREEMKTPEAANDNKKKA